MKKLEELLDIPQTPGLGEMTNPDDIIKSETVKIENLPKNLPDISGLAEVTDLTAQLDSQLEQFDKINASLPMVTGLGQMADAELDNLASKAEQAYDDLMDLGMNVDARYGSRMFEVAAVMLNAAISAKSTKLDKKLKMIDLQLKKLAIDKKTTAAEQKNQPVEAKGYIVTDRNSILEQIKNTPPKNK